MPQGSGGEGGRKRLARTKPSAAWSWVMKWCASETDGVSGSGAKIAEPRSQPAHAEGDAGERGARVSGK